MIEGWCDWCVCDSNVISGHSRTSAQKRRRIRLSWYHNSHSKMCSLQDPYFYLVRPSCLYTRVLVVFLLVRVVNSLVKFVAKACEADRTPGTENEAL